MPPRPPPIDATLFLSERQQEELDRIPSPLRLLGAWLLIVRDDSLGRWDERFLPCSECVDHGLPCIDPANGEPQPRCEGCYLSDIACGQELISSDVAWEQRPMADPFSNKKRKFEVLEQSSSRRSPSLCKLEIDSLLDIQDQQQASDRDTLPAGRPTRPSRRRAPRSKGAKSISSLPPKLIVFPPSPSRRFTLSPYRPSDIVANIDKARRHSMLNVIVLFDEKFDLADFQAFDYSVIIRSAGTLPSWLVAFVDNKRRKGRVLFDDRCWKADSAAIPARINLERAFHILHRSFTLEAEIYPYLAEDLGGSVCATELAVEFAMNGPSVLGYDLRVDKQRAIERHKLLRADDASAHSAVTVGREASVVAMISRHER